MKTFKALQFLPLLFLVLIVVFQNCSDVDLISLRPNRIQAADPIPTPTSTPGTIESVKAYAIGEYAGCALKDNSVYCWGANGTGALGNSTIPSGYPPGSTAAFSTSPLQVELPVGLEISTISLDVYGNHACVETTDSDFYCWGSNGSGELGNPSLPTGYSPPTLSPVPVKVIVPAGVILHGVTTGVNHTCALNTTGQPYCWGMNGLGELGLGTQSHVAMSVPTLIPTPIGVSFVSLSAGLNHTCGLTSSGSIYCWGGTNVYGEIGSASAPVYRSSGTPQFITPTLVSAPSGIIFTSVSAGAYSTCAMTSTNAVYCWGENSHGQLGNASIPSGPAGDGWNHYSKVPVPYLADQAPFVHVSAGGMLNCATTQSGSVLCRGQYAPATASAGTIYVPVNGEKFVSAVASGNTACGLTSQSDLYCWGSNFLGVLGIGNDLPGFSYTPLLVQFP